VPMASMHFYKQYSLIFPIPYSVVVISRNLVVRSWLILVYHDEWPQSIIGPFLQEIFLQPCYFHTQWLSFLVTICFEIIWCTLWVGHFMRKLILKHVHDDSPQSIIGRLLQASYMQLEIFVLIFSRCDVLGIWLWDLHSCLLCEWWQVLP